MTSNEFKVTAGTGVADVLANVDKMVDDAYNWVNSPECTRIYKVQMTRALWNELLDKITEMEQSFDRNFRKIMIFASQSGEVRLVWDSNRSLTAYEPKTGLTMGLIFHPRWVNGEPTPIGSWSLHS